MKLNSFIPRAVVASLGALALGLPAVHAGNLLLNPSIENGTSTTQIDNWTRHFDDTFREAIPVYGFTGTAMKDGLYAVKEFGGEGDLAQANISVHANTAYDISGWFYHSSTEDVIANSAISTRMFMHVEWFDLNNNSLRNDFTANHNGTSPADLWVQIYANYVSPAGSHHATFHVESDHDVGGGSVFGDDFYFAPEPATIGLIACGAALLGGLRRRRIDGNA